MCARSGRDGRQVDGPLRGEPRRDPPHGTVRALRRRRAGVDDPARADRRRRRHRPRVANLKPVDYVGHAYGPDSAELREAVAEVDRQVGRVLEAVAAKTGPRAISSPSPPTTACRRSRRPAARAVTTTTSQAHPRPLRSRGEVVTHYGAEKRPALCRRGAGADARRLAGADPRSRADPAFILYAYTEDEVARVRLPEPSRPIFILASGPSAAAGSRMRVRARDGAQVGGRGPVDEDDVTVATLEVEPEVRGLTTRPCRSPRQP
jgi:hypothetical protein